MNYVSIKLEIFENFQNDRKIHFPPPQIFGLFAKRLPDNELPFRGIILRNKENFQLYKQNIKYLKKLKIESVYVCEYYCKLDLKVPIFSQNHSPIEKSNEFLF